MNRIAAMLATVLSLAFTPLAAQDFNKGLEAYNAQDYQTVLREWRPLADRGESDVQFNLGVMYYSGRGVHRDYGEAEKWWRLAAEQGDAPAQYNLGNMYYDGQGVPQDYAEAVKWGRLAAEQGHASAQNNLGVAYKLGNGVLQSNVIAHMWFNIASANGSPESGERRDERAGLMTSADISKAQAMARECMNSGYKNCGY